MVPMVLVMVTAQLAKSGNRGIQFLALTVKFSDNLENIKNSFVSSEVSALKFKILTDFFLNNLDNITFSNSGSR